jgi:hypothetical protein
MRRIVGVAARLLVPDGRNIGYKAYIDTTKYAFQTIDGRYEFEQLVEPMRAAMLRDGIPPGIIRTDRATAVGHARFCMKSMTPVPQEQVDTDRDWFVDGPVYCEQSADTIWHQHFMD